MKLFEVAKEVVKPLLSRKKDDNSSTITELNTQIEALHSEREQALSSSDLTPETLMGKKRTYHYKDVNIWVIWKYSGAYGTTCKDIGIRRGHSVDLLPPKDPAVLESAGNDPESIAVVWQGIELGTMKSNRLRSMVHQWKSHNLPVVAAVSQVGGEQKIMFEFAFYGKP